MTTVVRPRLLCRPPSVSEIDKDWGNLPIARMSDRHRRELLGAADRSFCWHLLSRLRFPGAEIDAVYYGIYVRFVLERGTSLKFAGIFQETSVDSCAHPHFPSFIRGTYYGNQVRMCTGSAGDTINRIVSAREYDKLGHMLIYTVSHVNTRSLNSPVPSLITCSSCGQTSWQHNAISAHDGQPMICSLCDFVFIEGHPGRRLRAEGGRVHQEPRRPAWGSEVFGASTDLR